jgi:pimeloyl-ACP methyl ester carboxylesterase
VSTFLFVPGAWLGGWCWRDVAGDLRAAGHTVITPTLTGFGERAHLLSRDVGLQTHVADIASMLRYCDLSRVILVGHSHGGTVITAYAEHVPDLLCGLDYLNASVPREGKSNNDVIGPKMTADLRSAAEGAGEGWRVPPAAYVVAHLAETIRHRVEARLTPHPLRAFEEKVQLRSNEAAALPRAFIRTSLQSALYEVPIDRARAAGWYCRDLKGGHYAMLTEPHAVASALIGLPSWH